MSTNVRRHLPAIAAATAVAAVAAAAAPSIATARSPESSGQVVGKLINADRLNGYQAKDLVRASSSRSLVAVDDFDTCPFSTVLTMKVAAPKSGYLEVWGSLGAARDVSFTDDALLTGQVKVGKKVAATELSTHLTGSGTRDSHVALSGMIPVKKGLRTVKLQASECTTGAAYIASRSLSSMFVPFGHAQVVSAKTAKTANQP